MTAEEKIKAMTVEEKCSLLSGRQTFATRAFEKYEIPAVSFADGTSGLRKQAGAGDHLGMNASEPATCFPTIATVSAAWDTGLAEEVGEAMGEEAAAADVSVLLAPALNIKRNPLGGRNFEYVSEDPYLSGKIAASYVKGIQKNGVAACPKHFAANSQELRRMASDSVVDERTLREIYLTAFEMVVEEAHPYAMMTSYNMVNGIYANENRHLLQDILHDAWEFDGAVITDWGGSNDHAEGVKCGSTLEMPAPGAGSVLDLKKAVKEGRVSETDVDDRVRELLTLIDRTKPVREKQHSFSQEKHDALSRRAAEEGTVLLKNEGSILPLRRDAKIALLGEFVKEPRYQGEGSSKVNAFQVSNLYQALLEAGACSVTYEAGYSRLSSAEDESRLRKAAADAAVKADVAVLCVGLTEVQESEGLDRKNLRIPDQQTALIEAVTAVCDNVVVLVSAGGPVETPWIEGCRALIFQGLGGQQGARAAADILLGNVNPSGKLTESWPVLYEDVPSADYFPSSVRTAEYREGIYVGYRYYETAGIPVRFPFGYGLSYTTFAYSRPEASEDGMTLTVTNTGDLAGDEIVQLYVSKNGGHVFSPVRELKGFARVHLEPGESRRIRIPLDDKAFRYWNTVTESWETEEGSYTLCAGASCEDLRISEQVFITGTAAPDPYDFPAGSCYLTGKVKQVPGETFGALLGHEIPQAEHTQIDRSMVISEMSRSRSLIGRLAAYIVNRIQKKNEENGKTDLNIVFVRNMPLRAIAKMTGGLVDMRMVDAIVMELKGFWIIGILRFLVEFIRNRFVSAAFERRLKEERSI